jgi:hypothetical protein
MIPLALLLATFAAPATESGAAAIPAPDLHNGATVRREMAAYNPRYIFLMGPRMRALRDLERQVLDRESHLQDVACSHRIVTEIRWLMGSTVDIDRIDARLNDLRSSLQHPELESKARERDPVDGSWGHCYTEWFFRLDGSYDGHFSNGEGGGNIPLLDRVNSPEKLTDYVKSISISDVAHNGVNHRREMNEALSTLIRLIMRDAPRGYPWHPQLKATLRDLLLNQLRNPRTGWWGERYVRSGGTEFVDDLSMTFHIVSYLHGDVPDLDKVASTLLALKDLEYPIGWLEDRHYVNHHNMDVVVLFRYAWPFMNESQKREASAQIARMLQWCLRESALPDGSFRRSTGGDDSVEEGEYFGVAFLARAGYFDPTRRFWTTDAFPGTEQLRRRLIDFIRKHKATGAAGGAYYESALSELEAPANPWRLRHYGISRSVGLRSKGAGQHEQKRRFSAHTEVCRNRG